MFVLLNVVVKVDITVTTLDSAVIAALDDEIENSPRIAIRVTRTETPIPRDFKTHRGPNESRFGLLPVQYVDQEPI